jgi:alpha-tubulin suppressor-like RCC1 family protein
VDRSTHLSGSFNAALASRYARWAICWILLPALACCGTTAVDAPHVARISLGMVGGFFLNVGESARVAVTLLDSANHVLVDRVVTYSSSDTTVAVVTPSGTISALAPGTSTLTVSSGFASATALVGVAPGTPRFAQVEVGGSHTCALTRSGSLYCWTNSLVTAAGGSHGSPQLVISSAVFQAVTVGNTHQCALSDVGAAYCWGDNQFGQLGTGDTISASAPVPVTGGLVFGSISAGYRSTCAVTAGGEAYCWGSNASGELGDGTTVLHQTPVRVAGSLRVQSVSVGFASACAVTTSASAYCWGYNGSGQLGNGTTSPSATPVAVVGGLAFGAVTVGGGYACGLTTAGLADCWGGNSAGYLGAGTSDTLAHPAPAPVAGGLTWRALSAGDMACGVASTNVVYCWGSNLYDLLANGTPTYQSSVPAVVWGGFQFSSVSARGDHACAIAADEHVYCWGGYVS